MKVFSSFQEMFLINDVVSVELWCTNLKMETMRFAEHSWKKKRASRYRFCV